MRARPVAALLLAAAASQGCALMPKTRIKPVAADPPPEVMAQFWVEPADLASRDLYWGPGGRENAPDPNGRFEFVERSTGTFKFSRGFDVKDERGIKWSAKFWPESQTEVVASRLMWAIGFHQPPTYYVAHWTLSGDTGWAGPQGGARFRPSPRWLEREGDWSWHENPFTGTQPWRGALVMMVLINNSDLKPSQNNIYDLKEPREGARRWYVVRDLGASFGATGTLWARRNDPATFEKEAFIKSVDGGRVRFNYSGRWKELFQDLTPADVRWTCERLARLSPRQWRDAFRAADYREDVADRFIRRFQEKVAQGMALPSAPAATPAVPANAVAPQTR
jgi:hypothetical protein